MYGENDTHYKDQQISIEDDALDLRTDLKIMLTADPKDAENDYDENVDLLSSEKKARGPIKTGIKLPPRRIVGSKDEGNKLHLLEQLSSCYGVMSPQAKK